ncbi:unnamed protein product [Caenorhabditis sp. 36 PRJEB53466]|nr:unnamed protein product [Caenorhabditis sp. 36 PRJEB53466]
MNRFSVRTLSVSLLLLFLSLSVNCDPLTKDENENRLKTCGKAIQSKVYQGREAAQSEAPWSVFVNVRRGDLKATQYSSIACTGTLVSSRHILTATHCFAEISDAGWDTIIEATHDPSNCRGNDYVIEDSEWLKRIRVVSNKKRIARHPERVTLLGTCIPRQIASGSRAAYTFDDIAIIDLYEEVEFNENIHSACVSNSTIENKNGTELEYFGFGLNPKAAGEAPDPAGKTGTLRYENIKVFKKNYIFTLPDYYFTAANPEHKTVTCQGDSGGGSVSREDGRTTIVGVLSQTTCHVVGASIKNATELYASVGFYAETICEHTGICASSDRHEKHHKDYVRKAKPIRTTEAPKSRRLNDQMQGIPDGKRKSVGRRRNGGGARRRRSFQGIVLSCVLFLKMILRMNM